MTDQTPDEKAAAEIGCSPSEFLNVMQAWERNKIMRTILTSRIKRRIDGERTKLDTVANMEELKKTQGNIEGMHASIALINKAED